MSRTRVRRAPHKQVHERAALDALLDAALVAHVAVVDDGWPLVVPVAVARDGDQVLLHGSTGSRAFRALAAGTPTCVTVTVLDAVVVARSQFESSMNYRSAMLLGRCAALDGDAKDIALQRLSAALLPGVDWQRSPTRRELAATTVLALPIEEWSLKVSAKPGPADELQDAALPVWAGIVPLHHVWGEPVPAPDLPLDVDPAAPAAITAWPGRG